MLQHWASEGEFYTGGFVNSLSRLRLHIARFIFALHKKKYHIGRIFRYTEKHLEHLRNDVRPEIYISLYIYIFKRPLNRLGGLLRSQLHGLSDSLIQCSTGDFNATTSNIYMGIL